MSDLIRRDDAIERLQFVIDHGMRATDGDHPLSAETVLAVVKTIPTAEERKEGEWVDNKWLGEKCSVCGWKLHYINFGQFKYCPNCGARMKGDTDDSSNTL